MEKIKIVIVGMSFGQWLMETELINGPGKEYIEVVGVCDIDRDKAGKAAEKYGVKAYYDLKFMLEDSPAKAVGLFAGPAGRADLIRQIIRAGKDVMTTKPFELDTDKALEILQEAEDRGRVVHLNSPSPDLGADIQQIKLWQKKYDFGIPIAARAETWCSKREQPDGSWYDDPEKCPAAPIFRLGIYQINDIVQFLGQPESVNVMTSRLFTRRPTPDNAQLSIRFKNGAMANVFSSFCIDDGTQFQNTLLLNFQNATIYRDCLPSKERTDRKITLQLTATQKNGTVLTENACFDISECSGQYQWGKFYRAVNGQKLQNQINSQQIVAGIQVINQMFNSIRDSGA